MTRTRASGTRGAAALLLASAVSLCGCAAAPTEREAALDSAEWRHSKSRMYHQLALQCLRAGDHDRARRLLEQAVQFDADDERSLELLAWLAYTAGDMRAARNAARLLLTADQRSVAAWCTLGAIAEAEGRSDEAERAYRRAQELGPNDPRPWTDLHRMLLQQGREDEAAAVRARLAAEFPRRTETLLDQGSYLAAAGRWQEAGAAYRQAFEIEPRDIDVAARYALSTLVCDAPQQALDLGRGIAPRDRVGNPGVAIALAVAHIQRRGHAAALQELSLLPEVVASRPAIRLLRGELLLRTGRLDEAREELEAAIDGDPSSARAHGSLARIHLLQGRRHAAVRSLQKALQCEPRDGVAHALLAACRAADQDLAAAVRHRTAAARLPGTATVLAEVDRLFPQLAKATTGETPR